MISPTPFSLCFALLLCLPPLAFIFSNSTTFSSSNTRILITTNSPTPPPPPEDDESLLHLASKTNANPSPPHSPKRIAFLFLTTTPLPFSPLWELFFNQSKHTLFNIYIHADPTYNYTTTFSGIFSGKIIPSKLTQRYTPTLISAARRLLSHALLHDTTNSMFALLSPTCIPLHSFNFTYTTLISSSSKSFIEILTNEPGAYDRWVARGPRVMLPQVPLDRFRVGSQFFVLTRKHARLVVKDQRLWEKFKLPCVRDDVCYPEEHYFPTLMSMRDPHGCVPATLTHVDWSGRSDGHPRTYEASEVDTELILSLRNDRPRYGSDFNGSDLSVQRRNDPFLFARKFSPDSLQQLMKIANDVIFRD